MSRSLAASLICGVLAAACGGSSSTSTTSGTGGHGTGVGGANTGSGGMAGAGAGGTGTAGTGAAGNGTAGSAGSGSGSGGTSGAAGMIPIGGTHGRLQLHARSRGADHHRLRLSQRHQQPAVEHRVQRERGAARDPSGRLVAERDRADVLQRRARADARRAPGRREDQQRAPPPPTIRSRRSRPIPAAPINPQTRHQRC